MFCHYLITRFNVVKPGLNQYALSQRGNRIQTEEWLRRRFELFEKYCFPCVKNQTTQNFKWLVLFSADTPSEYLKVIEGYQFEYRNLIPLYVEPNTDEIALVKDFIRKNAIGSQVITTRLDNDDCIREDYLELTQKACKPEYNNVFLIYRYGYQYKEGSRIINWFGDDFNHFESRVELVDSIETVYVENDRHDLIEKYGSIVHLETQEDMKNKKGMWIEVVHEGNVVNNAAPYSSRPIWVDNNAFGNVLRLSWIKYLIVRVIFSLKVRLGVVE